MEERANYGAAWLGKYGGRDYYPIRDEVFDPTDGSVATILADARLLNYCAKEIQSLNDRIAKLEAGMRDLEARLPVTAEYTDDA